MKLRIEHSRFFRYNSHMSKNIKLINIFVAYISDVKEEVDVCKEIIDSLNIIFESSDYHLDLKTGDDVPSDYCPPQQKINDEKVNKCDIFIGIIWKRWGTGGSQGGCGFEEEFNIVEKRQANKADAPKIYIYKKKIDENNLNGIEKKGYENIKSFMQSIQSKCKYTDFVDKTDLKEKVKNRLSRYLYDKISEDKAKSPENVLPSLSNTKSETSTVAVSETKSRIPKIPNDLVKILNELKTTDLRKYNIYKIIRLFLFSSSLLYSKRIGEIIGNHEIHLLYLNREKIKLLKIEKHIIFRTILTDKYNLKTGWYWVGKSGNLRLDNYVINLLFLDKNEEVKLGALDFMDSFWSKRYLKFVSQCTVDASDQIIRKALYILKKYGDIKSLNIIENYLVNSNNDIAKEAWEAKFTILMRQDLEKAKMFFLEYKSLRNNGYISNIVKILTREEIKDLLKEDNSGITDEIYSYLINNKKINESEIKVLASSEDFNIRIKAINSLMEMGEPIEISSVKSFKSYPFGYYLFDDKLDKIIIELLKKKEKDKICQKFQWLSENGKLDYYVYYTHFGGSIEEVRLDIENNYKKMKENFLESYIEGLNKEIRTVVKRNENISEENYNNIVKKTIEIRLKENEKQISKVNEYGIKEYSVYSLKILYEKGEKDDLKYAKKYFKIDDEQLHEQIINMYNKWGDEKDIDDLVEIAKNSKPDLKMKYGELAIKFDRKEKKSVISKYLETEDEVLIKISLKYLLACMNKKHVDRIKKLLLSENDDIRLYALSYLVQVLNMKEMKKLLSNYLGDGARYFYNIVCWLDRILYSPARVKKHYREQLKKLI